MVAHIIALDCEESFTQESMRLVHDLELSSIEVVLGPLMDGWEQEAPYDKILIEGCVDHIPLNLTSQLKEGGQLISIKCSMTKERVAVKIDKKQGTTTESFLFDAFGPRLKSFETKKMFVF